ncbi:gamma-butyrobetaine hydroxylase-like domain-containing protein [Thalassobaculum sp.]|uniref:gamma-butyrobetaine hydroxylase-like domain-containing protein n=1 Tax=Thalassobaculum sp. TaxID=2022740 RepID=UPI003B59D943
MSDEAANATTGDWPTELRVTKDRAALAVSFESGVSGTIPAELMRVESPSAEVQGHSAAGKTLVAGKRAVTIRGVEPVGNYAVRITFSDGHDTGLFTWRYLRELVENGGTMMAAYEEALAKAGLTRG